MPALAGTVNLGEASGSTLTAVRGVVAWYVARCLLAPGAVPFYCDAGRVGPFAVPPAELAEGTDAALFRLFVSLSMYQALRDVVIMRRQRTMTPVAAAVVASLDVVGAAVKAHECAAFAADFESTCDVTKEGGVVDCGLWPGRPCHVKDATAALQRQGDTGKLPTSAWLKVWRSGTRELRDRVCAVESSPTRRADLLVTELATIHRVGRKLATLFVSALSTPALSGGLAPWFPEVDGNELVVVDTNVARAVDVLRSARAPQTYSARALWVQEVAGQIDLREFQADLPAYSPRLVQEALYAFGSKSNRTASGDPCVLGGRPCGDCVPLLCPLLRRSVSV